MTRFPKKFIALLTLDAVSILIGALLLLQNFWQLAIGIVIMLFMVNFFLVSSIFRTQRSENRVSNKSRSKLWFWGFALLIAAVIRSAFFVQSGFSWPGFVGVIAGILLGSLFLLIAKKSKEIVH